MRGDTRRRLEDKPPYLAPGMRRGFLQALLVGIGCGEVLGLLSGFDAGYQGSLAKARQPFALMRSPFGAGGWRSQSDFKTDF